MQNTPPQQDRRYYSYQYRKRPRGPRFALLILIIMAILSIVLALTVAYLLI